MINRLSDLLLCLLVVIMLVVPGCEQAEKETVVLPLSLEHPDYVIPDFALRPIEATGGQRAWAKAENIQLDCVVTFYKPDGTFYLTEHNYQIDPLAGSILISAAEPKYRFIWRLSEGQFSILEGAECAKPLPIAMSRHQFAEAILNITTAPVRFLDTSFEFTRTPDPVKIEGKWYHPIERKNIVVGADDKDYIKPRWDEAVFCQNRDNSLVDMIWFVAAGEKKFLMVRGYDYRRTKEKAPLVPAKIEIFKTDPAGSLRQRLVKIDLK